MASKLDPKRATQLQWFHGSVRCDRMKMTTIMTAVVDPKVSRNMEKLVKLIFYIGKRGKTTHLREELWDWLALGTLEPWRAGHEWKPPTDLVLPGAETGWVLHCFPGKKGDGWVWELLGTHNFLSLQAWWYWIMWEAFSRNTRMFSYIKFIIYAFTKSPTTTSDNSVPKQGTAVKTDAAEIVANSLKDQVTPWCTVRMWQVTGVGTSPKRWCVKE